MTYQKWMQVRMSESVECAFNDFESASHLAYNAELPRKALVERAGALAVEYVMFGKYDEFRLGKAMSLAAKHSLSADLLALLFAVQTECAIYDASAAQAGSYQEELPF